MASEWYYRAVGEEFGPVGFRHLASLIRSGTLTGSDGVRSAWQSGWQRADSVVGLLYMADRLDQFLDESDRQPAPAAPLTPVAPLAAVAPKSALSFHTEGVADSSDESAPSTLCALSDGSDRMGPRLPSGTPEWGATVAEALGDLASRGGVKFGSGNGSWSGHLSRVFEVLVATHGQWRSSAMKLARVALALLAGCVIAVWVTEWSAWQALRFPREVLMGNERMSSYSLPLIGHCSHAEFVVVVADAAVVTATALYWALGSAGSRFARENDSRRL